MKELLPSIESQENFFSISARSEGRLPDIKKQLKAGRQVAFLVTSDFKVHVGSTGLHGDIAVAREIDPEDKDAIIFKGHISGSSKKIYFDKADGSRNETSDQYHQADIKQKINDFIDFPDYFQ